jgi:hypothetical protein
LFVRHRPGQSSPDFAGHFSRLHSTGVKISRRLWLNSGTLLYAAFVTQEDVRLLLERHNLTIGEPRMENPTWLARNG